MVLIARAVSKQCRILVLDEPTAPLSHSETEQLFAGAQAKSRTESALFSYRTGCRSCMKSATTSRSCGTVCW